jgi:hypothetical protein
LMRRMGIAALSPGRASRRRAQDIPPAFCAGSSSSGRTRSGARTSPTFRSAAAFSTSWRSWTGPAGRRWRADCPTPRTPRSPSRPCRRRSPALAARTSSIPTKAANSPAQPSPARSPPPGRASRSTGAAARWTTSSSNCSGARSSTRHLPQRLCRRSRGPHRDRRVVLVLQYRALGNRAPMAVRCQAAIDATRTTAVDMTLRLVNADALPTCPQPQQQRPRFAA